MSGHAKPTAGRPSGLAPYGDSGTGDPLNNIPFTTSAATEGWIGCYAKTTNTAWQIQIWIEQTVAGNNNAGVPKDLIADGQWHLYEWDLDNTAGDADGWQDILGLGAGPIVADGSHTIDSIVLRNADVAAPPVLSSWTSWPGKTADWWGTC